MDVEMETEVSLELEANAQPENIKMNECGCGGTNSTQKLDEQLPASIKAKKPTRRWAAWTHQEEEMFFNALRQYGKNFEKITNRIPGKNKDQVRHYYYRLLRRMNKLLGPEVSLDASNSKDTNAAMLRWWTLLEKYSCKSSKLHLKPRRFKIFLETLENQLLKDRKKCKRKQSSQRENCPPTTPMVLSHEGPAVRLVLVDSQNIQQSNAAKEIPLKRNAKVGTNRRSSKSVSLPASTVGPRKKPATSSKAAYKKWEKAAIAGVSLVADAAEHLERTTIDKEVDHVQGQIVSDPAGSDIPSCSAPSPNASAECNAQNNVKLKLQLFPIDEGTRKALEIDSHNPHLELTLSTRKKISSVVEHLNRKWGNSSVASGEIMLFPYYAQSDNLAGYLRWTQDSILSAAEVYALIGSPTLFRLRYGWCSNADLTTTTVETPLVSSGMISNHKMNVNDAKERNKNQIQAPNEQVLEESPMDVAPSLSEVPNELSVDVEVDNTLPQCSVFCNRRESSKGSTLREGFSQADSQLRNSHPLSAGQWADSLTTISIGDLLSEVSHNNTNNEIDPLLLQGSQPQQDVPFSCDSFDAAIAAHIYRHGNKNSYSPSLSPFEASIWEAEETCDAFSFRKSIPRNEAQGTSFAGYGANVQETLEMEVPTDEVPVLKEPVDECTMAEETEDDNNSVNENLMDERQSDPVPGTGLTDMFWPDSLGPLDLDMPTSKYHNEELILTDSLSGFSRLLGNSFDAFQNCSFFGFDKEKLPGVEAQEPASFSDYKIGSGVSDFAKA